MFKEIIYRIDFIGIKPQLRVLNYSRYHSILSIIISIALIIFTVYFTINSIIQYKNRDPSVYYYKTIDQNKKQFLISDSFIIVQLKNFDKNLNDFSFSALYFDKNKLINYNVEPCEIGKNINLKYKELFENILNRFGNKKEDYYCIDFNNTNIDLYTEYKDNEKLESGVSIYLSFNRDKEIDSDKTFFTLNIITEDDYTNHNEYNGIIRSYHFEKINIQKLYMYTRYIYEFNFLNYESDNGYLFENIKTNNGVTFSQINFEETDTERMFGGIFEIEFKLNPLHYDYYKRSYKNYKQYYLIL